MQVSELTRDHIGKRFRVKLHEDDAYMDIQEEIEADTWVCISPYRLQSETREELEILLLLQSEVFEI